jgi:hypothetical protein
MHDSTLYKKSKPGDREAYRKFDAVLLNVPEALSIKARWTWSQPQPQTYSTVLKCIAICCNLV